MTDFLEICEDCGHATNDPDILGDATMCPECRSMESYECVEVCDHCYANAFNYDELCDKCKGVSDD